MSAVGALEAQSAVANLSFAGGAIRYRYQENSNEVTTVNATAPRARDRPAAALSSAVVRRATHSDRLKCPNPPL